MKKVGIIGGIGMQSTLLFYEELMKACQAREVVEYPNLLINSLESWQFYKRLDRRDELVNYLVAEISKLTDHVDFIVIVCNTAHTVIEDVQAKVKTPILGMHEAVADEISRSPCRKIGILGTSATIESELYQKTMGSLGIATIVPDRHTQEELNHSIMHDMLRGNRYDHLEHLIVRQRQVFREQGCTGTLLACTELPMFTRKNENEECLFFSTQILLEAMMAQIFEK